MVGSPRWRGAGPLPRMEEAAPRVLLALALLLVAAASACGVDRSSEGSATSTSGRGPTTTEDGSTTTSSVTSTSTDTSSTSESSTTTAPTTTTTEAPPPTFTEYAHIATWYTPAEADDSEWVHFKAVDEGATVAEVLGSDLMNMVDEANAMAQTPARVDLVDRLRQQMVDDGWTEIGVDGDWYEYQFGR